MLGRLSTHGWLRPVTTPGVASSFRRAASALSGPDAPTGIQSFSGQPKWPANEWHDHLQYHFFFDGLFVQARVFMTPSLQEHAVWVYDHKKGKIEELLSAAGTSEAPHRLTQAENADYLELSSPRLQIQDGPHGGSVELRSAAGSDAQLKVEFENRNVFSWLPGGQKEDAVIHRPNLELKLTYGDRVLTGHGYSKRYFGHGYVHSGWRFIQSSWLGGRYFLWTADATFRLGEGEAKYNYWKLLDAETGELSQAESKDTYQQDDFAQAEIDGAKHIATVEPLAEWLHDYKAAGTNSRMQLRYCKVTVQRPGQETLEGYALNERCFGVIG